MPLENLTARYASWRERQSTRRLFATSEGQRAIQANRVSLAQVTQWIEEPRYQNSIFQYGLPPYLRPHIDTPLDNQPTYTDLIVLLSQRLSAPLSYLEIGVSVGKNLFQVLQANPGADVAALELEEENPPFLAGFSAGETRSWISNSAQRPTAYARNYRNEATGTDLLYVCADELDPKSWSAFAGKQFNMIFSDALHEPHALRFELEQILTHDLLDNDEWVMLWDDMHSPPLREAFDGIVAQLQLRYRRLRSRLLRVNGWVGSAEPAHLVGVVAHGLRL